MAVPLHQIDAERPSPRLIELAARILREGGVICYPTDTCYGIGCALNDKRAAERLRGIKGMGPKKPMALLVPDVSTASRYARVNDTTFRLLRRITPGPYAFLLRATKELPRIAASRQKTVGVRIPDHPVCLALLEALGEPILNTSATTPQGELISDPRTIREKLAVDLVLDCGMNLFDQSTVVDLTDDVPEVIRVGKGPVEEFQ